MEIRIDAYQHRRHAVRQSIPFHAAYNEHCDKSDQEHQTSHQTEEMHRLFAELIEKPESHQIQIAVHEPVQTEFGSSELSLAVLHHFLAYLGESGVLSQIRDITVHLAEDLDVLHYLQTVGFQSAVHVVQLNAGHSARRCVEELGRQVLGQFVVISFLLPSAYQIIPLFLDHTV